MGVSEGRVNRISITVLKGRSLLFIQLPRRGLVGKLPLVLTAKVDEHVPSLCFDTYQDKGDGSKSGKAKRWDRGDRGDDTTEMSSWYSVFWSSSS
jgi:hypothetical protein